MAPSLPVEADGDRREAEPILTGERLVLGVAALVAFGTYVVLARGLWFYSDEWDYIVERDIGDDPTSLFWPHNDQWQTIPVIVFRALLQVTGLRTYVPYLVLMVAVYVASCLLVHAVMRRAGVDRWIAVALTVALLFLGSANENAVFAAQLTYMGSIAFGLASLWVAMGPPSRRQLPVASALGVAALMCSNIGVFMVALVALWLWMHRGFRAGVLVAAAPAAAFVIWWSVYRVGRGTDLGGAIDFVRHGLAGAGDAFTQLGTPGSLLVVLVLAAGIAVSIHAGEPAWRTAVPLVATAVAFLALTGSQRAAAFGPEAARQTRYAGVVITLLVPVAGLAATALVRRWRVVGALAVLPLVIGIPSNVGELSTIRDRVVASDRARALIAALPHAPGFRTAPSDQRPFPESWLAPQLTVGYVREADAAGDLPAHEGSPALVDEAAVRLALYQSWAEDDTGTCDELTAPLTLTPRRGETLVVDGGFVRVVASIRDGPPVQTYFNPNRGDALAIRAEGVTVELSTYGVNGPAALCRP